MYWLIANPITKYVLIGLAGAAIVGGVAYYVYDKGYDTGQLEMSVKMAEQEAAHQRAISDLQNQAQEELQRQRNVEKELSSRINDIQKEKEDAIKTTNDTHARVLNRLRNRLTRAEADLKDREARDSSTPAPDSTGAVCTGAQLLREDGEFLAGEAARADVLREALKACRRSYEEIRQRNN